MSDEVTPILVGKEVVSDDQYVVASVCFCDGDRVEKGDVIGSFETSKGVVDLEAPDSGYVFYNVAVDEDVPVGTVFAAISRSSTIDAGFFATFRQQEVAESGQADPAEGTESDVRLSKAARALVDQHRLDVAVFGGKPIVREADVLDYLQSTGQGSQGNSRRQCKIDVGRGNDLVIVGGGGHAKICIDILRGMKTHRIVGLVDAKLQKGTQTLGVPVVGTEDQLEQLFHRGVRFAAVGFAALSRASARQAAYERLKRIGYALPNLIHPLAILEPSASLGEGNHVMAGAIIGSDARIGNNCIVNSGSIVSHDCLLRDNAHLTPGAILAGMVEVGRNTVIGMGATILMRVKVGSNVVVNNGARVSKDIPDGTIVKE